ncbi:alpha/beta hydrolase [Sphingomonas sp. RB3P16]|uniref:alpha/beta hydrolase n=1 Tax=Parasphingomonas frigoris TaxID=3096163 RepID=UPI002FC791B7
MDEDRTIRTAQPIVVAAAGDPIRRGDAPHVVLDLAKFHSGRWALQLDALVARRDTPVVILAQGVACLAVAWWAQLSPRSYVSGIKGALLLAPLDVGFGQEAIAASARSGPTTRLPFPSVVAHAAYPFAEPLLALADAWGSDVVDIAAPIDLHPSNRRPAGRSETEQLLGFLDLLYPAATAEPGPHDPIHPVDLHLT